MPRLKAAGTSEKMESRILSNSTFFMRITSFVFREKAIHFRKPS